MPRGRNSDKGCEMVRVLRELGGTKGGGSKGKRVGGEGQERKSSKSAISGSKVR